MKFLHLERNAAQMKRKQEELREAARARAAVVSSARRRSVKWTTEQLKRATGPLVYIWWGATEYPLYIGMSTCGLSRAVCNSHHNSDIRQQAASIEFISCTTVEEAVELERDLIRYMKPQHNRMRY